MTTLTGTTHGHRGQECRSEQHDSSIETGACDAVLNLLGTDPEEGARSAGVLDEVDGEGAGSGLVEQQLVEAQPRVLSSEGGRGSVARQDLSRRLVGSRFGRGPGRGRNPPPA